MRSNLIACAITKCIKSCEVLNVSHYYFHRYSDIIIAYMQKLFFFRIFKKLLFRYQLFQTIYSMSSDNTVRVNQ